MFAADKRRPVKDLVFRKRKLAKRRENHSRIVGALSGRELCSGVRNLLASVDFFYPSLFTGDPCSLVISGHESPISTDHRQRG